MFNNKPMDSLPYISIIVLCYNQENTIRRTLDSILTQEHSYKIELIVCDDASCDNTPYILKEFEKLYPDIIKLVLRKKNLGIPNSFYDALSYARGEYVMLCAGDDYWLPDKITKQIKKMEEDPEIGLSYSYGKVVNFDNQIIGSYTDYNNITAEDLLYVNPIPAPSIGFKKKLYDRYIDEVNPEAYKWMSEDYPLLLWFAVNSKILAIEEELVAYYYNLNSITHSKDIRKNFLSWYSDAHLKLFFINKYNIGSPTIKNILVKEFKYLAEVTKIISKNKAIILYEDILQNYRVNLSLKQNIKIQLLRFFPSIFFKIHSYRYVKSFYKSRQNNKILYPSSYLNISN